MKRHLRLLVCWAMFIFALAKVAAADAPPPVTREAEQTANSATNDPEQQKVAAAAAAAATAASPAARAPDFLEHLVDSILGLFDVSASGNTVTHYVISALLLVIALLARRIVTGIIFPALRRLAAKTETTLDDKLFPALETPVAAFVMLVGIFAALKVLKLSAESDRYIASGSTVAFSLVIFWGFWRALSAVIDHADEVARARSLGVAAFMPSIKKAIMTVFVALGVLLTMQSLGYDVKAILAGLGIGSLAFALAAQDSLANIFGAIVVAVDQPFRIGDTVKIGQNVGGVEDIGLRSTRIRLVDKSLMTIPNKTVAAETITNLSRFTRRRVEQVIGLTYATKPDQMTAIVDEIKGLIAAQPEVEAASVMVFFRDFNASSLDVWLVYEIPDPDFKKHMAAKQRINLLVMRAVAARGLSFAYPTQTIELAGEVAERLAGPGSALTRQAPP